MISKENEIEKVSQEIQKKFSENYNTNGTENKPIFVGCKYCMLPILSEEKSKKENGKIFHLLCKNINLKYCSPI